MTHSFKLHFFHLIWSTKNRKDLIHEDIRDRLYVYLGGIAKNYKGNLMQIGGMPNHIHILLELSLLDKYSYLLRDLKACSSLWIHKTFPAHRHFAWQEGFASYTVSYSEIEKVRTYILNQEQHHKKMTFEEEYQKLLELHRVKFDPRFLLD